MLNCTDKVKELIDYNLYGDALVYIAKLYNQEQLVKDFKIINCRHEAQGCLTPMLRAHRNCKQDYLKTFDTLNLLRFL